MIRVVRGLNSKDANTNNSSSNNTSTKPQSEKKEQANSNAPIFFA